MASGENEALGGFAHHALRIRFIDKTKEREGGGAFIAPSAPKVQLVAAKAREITLPQSDFHR